MSALSGLIRATSVGVECCLVVLLSSFLMTNDVKHLFYIFISYLDILFCDVPVQIPCPFLYWIFCIFMTDL